MREKPTIIITGASRGLGAAIAKQASFLGANLVLTARDKKALKKQVAAIQDGAKAETLIIQADITQEKCCATIVNETINHFGRIDALVNNSGELKPIRTISEANPHEWEHNWAVNLLGPVMLTKQSLPYLIKTRGRVINISSGAAIKAIQGWGAYSVSKAALNHFTQLLAKEEDRITTLAIRPGKINTDMQSTIREEGSIGMELNIHQNFIRYFEQGKLLPPESPGRAVACLALFALHEWSGELISWDDPKVQTLVDDKFSSFSNANSNN